MFFYPCANKIGIIVRISLLLLCLGIEVSYAQRVNSDTTIVPADTLIADTLESQIEFVPGDLIFIPADYLYDHIWDNDRIRTTKSAGINKSDTTMIVLRKENESPFVFPHKGRLLSPFGPRGRRIHTGTDVKLNLGDSVLCAFDGKVRIAKRYSGYGNMVVVRHNNGLETLYGHLSKILVEPNDDVKAGSLLGLGGRTGHATTEHVHYETRFRGEPFNSSLYIDFDTFTLKTDTLYITGKTFEVPASKKYSLARSSQGVSYSREKSTSSPTWHTIKKGDSMYSIARKYKTTPKILCKLNKCTLKKMLKPGGKIRVR